MLRFLPILFVVLTPNPVPAAEEQYAPSFQAVECEGTYPHHPQGVCTDEREAIFWCFTTQFSEDVIHEVVNSYVATKLTRRDDAAKGMAVWQRFALSIRLNAKRKEACARPPKKRPGRFP